MGIPPHRDVKNVRLEYTRDRLMQTDLPILHIALECGFSSQSHLTAAFKATHATTPAVYKAITGRKGTIPNRFFGRGEQISAQRNCLAQKGMPMAQITGLLGYTERISLNKECQHRLDATPINARAAILLSAQQG